MGDSEEHAMLLCNYFNHIDRAKERQKIVPADTNKKDYHSYIVYGEAIPIGECWFVMRRDKVQPLVELWNPMTAESYSFDRSKSENTSALAKSNKDTMNVRSHDPQCPLKKVWCVVG